VFALELGLGFSFWYLAMSLLCVDDWDLESDIESVEFFGLRLVRVDMLFSPRLCKLR
jgi:hypothetical protein